MLLIVSFGYSLVMNNQFDTFVSFFFSPFWPSWNSPLPATFLTLKMISVDSLTPKTQVKTQNLSLQDRSRLSYIGYKGAAAVLDAILNYTFLPHIWNVYPSFFLIFYGPPTRIRSQNQGTYHCTQDPPQPQDQLNYEPLIGYPKGRCGHFGGHLGIPLYPLLFFNPENDFIGFLDPQNLGKDTKCITPRQIPMELDWV